MTINDHSYYSLLQFFMSWGILSVLCECCVWEAIHVGVWRYGSIHCAVNGASHGGSCCVQCGDYLHSTDFIFLYSISNNYTHVLQQSLFFFKFSI